MGSNIIDLIRTKTPFFRTKKTLPDLPDAKTGRYYTQFAGESIPIFRYYKTLESGDDSPLYIKYQTAKAAFDFRARSQYRQSVEMKIRYQMMDIPTKTPRPLHTRFFYGVGSMSIC